MSRSAVQHRPLYDRFLTLRYSATRNRLAAAAAFVSGALFLLSGYEANLEIYDLIRMEIITIESIREFWGLLLSPFLSLSLKFIGTRKSRRRCLCSSYFPEEQPQFVIEQLAKFFGR